MTYCHNSPFINTSHITKILQKIFLQFWSSCQLPQRRLSNIEFCTTDMSESVRVCGSHSLSSVDYRSVDTMTHTAKRMPSSVSYCPEMNVAQTVTPHKQNHLRLDHITQRLVFFSCASDVLAEGHQMLCPLLSWMQIFSLNLHRLHHTEHS